MVEVTLAVKNQLGLHARAAARLVRTANRFQSSLRLERIDGSASADAKSILNVLDAGGQRWHRVASHRRGARRSGSDSRALRLV